ncbi:MAG TPA: solute carrier family 23 protein [Candidatus Methylomirabilis sp.]|nr:solute carrier family 23 protein [Candidatus Methylomirabilis sp.]
MSAEPFFYTLDDRPPLWRSLLYGLQWALIMFPAVTIVASIAAEALQLPGDARVAFFQRMLFLSGGATVLQTLVGHRYPVQEGPSTALLLTFVVLTPQGLGAIQGGFLCGGVLLFTIGMLGWMGRLGRYFTPNVVGVILLLIALTLIPQLVPRLTGISPAHPAGEGAVFAASLFLILLITGLASRLRGFLQTTAILLGILAGSLGFWAWGRVDLAPVGEAAWLAVPGGLWAGTPHFSPSGVLSSLLAYVAVTVNAVGSIHGVAGVIGAEDVARRTDRGIAVTGLAGVAAAGLGVVGTVGFSTSPGVILVTRVASRYGLTACGGILVAAGLVSRLSALLAAVPAPVVGAALTVALASQVGAAITALTAGGRSLAGRDYLVVGLPVLLGSLVATAPSRFFAGLPALLGTIVGNGLVLGILLVLLLEHVLMPLPVTSRPKA